MKAVVVTLLLCGAAAAASLHIRESAFVAAKDGRPAGWTEWSARPETSPRVFVDPLRGRNGPGSLAISGNSNLAEHGGWEREVGAAHPASGSVSPRITMRSGRLRIVAGRSAARLAYCGRPAGRATRLCVARDSRRVLDQVAARGISPRNRRLGSRATLPLERTLGHAVVG